MEKVNKEQLIEAVKLRKSGSAWRTGVKLYALDMLYDLPDNWEIDVSKPFAKEMKHQLLNGADNWLEYSMGGCALISDEDIAERLMPHGEFERAKARGFNGRKFLDCGMLKAQARALSQACLMITGQAYDLSGRLL